MVGLIISIKAYFMYTWLYCESMWKIMAMFDTTNVDQAWSYKKHLEDQRAF